MQEIFQAFQRLGVLPVAVIDDRIRAAPVCRALIAGGLDAVEITFRTEAAAESIRLTREEIPEMLAGAGTILTLDHAKAALDAGALFVVTPGFNPHVVEYCLRAGVPIIPGCSTPTDLTAAVDYGLEVVKFFPAEALGGLAMLKALAAPFGMLRFVPTGGIDPLNLREYLEFDRVLACGGTWMVKPDAVREGQYDLITSASRRCVDIVNEVREMERAVKG